jgi:hypothetical protein
MRTDQFLHAITSIGKRACWLAGKRDRTEPTAEEINRASQEFIAGVCGEIESLARKDSKTRTATSSAAVALQPERSRVPEQFPQRGITPASPVQQSF